jgi:hypothetical protein
MQDIDFRDLPRRPDLEPMLMRVESLGVSCELGLVQRHCGAESLGLFRFGFTPLDGLIAALNDDFSAIGDPSQLAIISANKEWVTHHRTYGFECHTDRRIRDVSRETVRRQASAHFAFLAGKLKEDLAGGEKLFFYRPETPGAPDAKCHALWEGMQRFGRPVLCWVDIAPEPEMAGKSAWIVPGRLMAGTLDRYASTRFAAGASFHGWLTLIESSLALWDATRSGPEATTGS